MNNLFCKETEHIYRLKVPFENIYTSVFLIRAGDGAILIDCATTPYDVDNYIVPALSDIGYNLSDIRSMVLTHSHRDHSGGAKRIMSLAPHMEIITDIRILSDSVSTYPMGGHTRDSIGILDGRTRTLISGDGLQGAGVDRFRCSVGDPQAYSETIEHIRNDERIENILFSHAYEPWNTDGVFGREQVCGCLEECKKYVRS